MNSPNKLVSVIIPCYNYAGYVQNAIQSVLEQTYKNVEIIVINDGSTDKSDLVIQDLQKYHKFKYINQQNRGVIAVRNMGLKEAKGEYLLQLDADDWLAPTYVEETVKYAQKYELDIVYTRANIFGRTSFVTDPPEFNLEYLKHDGYIHASSLISTKILKKYKYDDYLNDKGNEDWDLFLDMCMDGARAGLLKKPLLNYRKHAEHESRADKFEGTKKELLVRHHILSKQNSKHPDQMWYFSPYINLLKDYIDDYEMVAKQQARLNFTEKELLLAQQKVKKYENLLGIRFFRWIKLRVWPRD